MEYTRANENSYEFKRCSKGHFYDPRLSTSCPVCAEEEEAVRRRMVAENFEVPPTGALDPRKTKPVEEYSTGEPAGADISRANRGQTDRLETHAVNSMVDEIDVTSAIGFEKTDAKGFDGSGEFFNPLVGWLVCTEGPSKGTDYRIYSGYNYIGRDQSMDICILGDSYISRSRHAMITFDTRTSRFYFGPFGGQSIVRLNDEIVLAPVEIKIHDILEIGRTKLMFIPLCDGTFTW